MRISDWSSDVRSSDLPGRARHARLDRRDDARQRMAARRRTPDGRGRVRARGRDDRGRPPLPRRQLATLPAGLLAPAAHRDGAAAAGLQSGGGRSEEHTSELQSLMRISYAVFCLKKKNTTIET